jgi:glycosyltransferase involved in cell wall biosynthesis
LNVSHDRIVYDITRLVTRVFKRTPNGIDRVDHAMASHFLSGDADDRSGLLMTALGPRVLTPAGAREAIDNIRKHWGEDEKPESDEHYLAVVAAINGAAASTTRISKGRKGQFADARTWLGRHGFPWGQAPGKFLAPGGVYLNVSQFLLESNWYLRWLEDQRDVTAVFFIHDLLPLEMPEYFLPAEHLRHARRMNRLARLGSAAIVSSEVVRDALSRQLVAIGRTDMPILVAHLPPDPSFASRSASASPAERHPYFVMCGTIEPRKNHLLLLHLWRDLAAELGEKTPKLVLIGARGWENEHIIDMLERCPALRHHVIEVSGLPTPSVKRLLLESRGLLMPSFAEGYGLPIVEALAAGVPVVASDIPVFREIGDGRLLAIDPTDGPGWRTAIRAFMEEGSPIRAAHLAKLNSYSAPTWPGFFDRIESFLDDLTQNGRRSART